MVLFFFWYANIWWMQILWKQINILGNWEWFKSSSKQIWKIIQS
jgi:hypothetical protein